MNPTLRWVSCALTLMAILPGCGNKGELILESDTIIEQDLGIPDESLLDPDDTENEKKTKKKPQ